MKSDAQVAIGVVVALGVFFGLFFLGISNMFEGFQSQSVQYQGVVVSDSADNGVAHIVLSNSTGNWDVYCALQYSGTIPSTTSIFHYKVVVPSDSTIVVGLKAGQNISIVKGAYGCKVS